MIKMLYKCESLVSLNLFLFNICNVLDVTKIFYNYTSLKIIDISNFYFIKYNMFSNIDNNYYIDIKYLQSDKKILIVLTKKIYFMYVNQYLLYKKHMHIIVVIIMMKQIKVITFH